MSTPSPRRRRVLFALAAAIVLGAAAAPAQVLAPNLLYTSVQPCRVFDTRFATNGTNGRLVHNVTQTFNVVGNTADPYFSGQGGHSGGCGIPGFTTAPTPQVQAVVLNFVAVNAAAAGDLVAWPTDQAQPNSSVLNYASAAALAGLNIANGIVIPVRQNSQGGDISLKAQVADTDVLADVVGYFSSSTPVQSPGALNLFLGTRAGNQGVANNSFNTAIGVLALSGLTSGEFNTAIGSESMEANTSGFSNTAIGAGALGNNLTGTNNIAIGGGVLGALESGTFNIAIGGFANGYTGAESSNILIGNSGTTGDNNTIRIGVQGSASGAQNATFIAGISGATASSGTEVFVNAAGQLGTSMSSLRFKEGVADMGEASDELMRLRPVTFRYRAGYDDGSQVLQYGLVAEEVAKVYPGLVQYDADGRPLAVRYHFVNAMLLNEMQKQHARGEEQAAALTSQATTLAAQQARIAELEQIARAQQVRLDAQAAEIAAQRASLELLAAKLEAPASSVPPRLP
jgi:hypothetical protein